MLPESVEPDKVEPASETVEPETKLIEVEIVASDLVASSKELVNLMVSTDGIGAGGGGKSTTLANFGKVESTLSDVIDAVSIGSFGVVVVSPPRLRVPVGNGVKVEGAAVEDIGNLFAVTESTETIGGRAKLTGITAINVGATSALGAKVV